MDSQPEEFSPDHNNDACCLISAEPVVEVAESIKALIVFAMGKHERVGSQSPIRILPDDLVYLIVFEIRQHHLVVPSEEYPTIQSAIKGVKQANDVILLAGQVFEEQLFIGGKDGRSEGACVGGIPFVIEGVAGKTVIHWNATEYGSVINVLDGGQVTFRNLTVMKDGKGYGCCVDIW